MRTTIERVFSAPVYNRYGTREVGDIACQRHPNEGLRIADISHVVEILRDDGSPCGPGEDGYIVITHLVNFAMPFIRYRIGDRGSWAASQPEDKPAWSMLNPISGRVSDPFVRRDRSIVTPEYMIHMIGVVLNKGWLTRFQVVQQDYDKVVVRLVTQDPADECEQRHATDLAEICKIIQLVMGDECSVSFEFPDDIPPEASGKFRYVVSKVTRP